jgi:CubicO group peptidase (beta-lactamase class C family)
VPDGVDRARHRARARAAARGARPRRLRPRSRRPGLHADELLEATFTDGFLLLQDGAVVTERYLAGMRETDPHLIMSCSKSFTSILCGVLAGRGLLAPDDLVTEHLPELAGSAWDGCRIQHLLDMRAGNAWSEADEYLGFDVSDYRTHDLHGTIPQDTETWIRTIARGSDDHGSGPFRYCSLVTDVLGWVLERVGGAAFPELFSREIWSRIGAEEDARIILDRSGFALVEGGICATLRDFGRFGQMCLDEGRALGRQIVPAEWIARVGVHDAELIHAYRTSDEAMPEVPDAFYHDNWWIYEGPRGVYAALGMNGQSILIHRPARIAIAKFSTYPDALDSDLFALDQAGLAALCEHLA